MVTLAASLPLVPLILCKNWPLSCKSCYSMPSAHLFYRHQVRPVRFSVSSILSSPLLDDQCVKFVEASRSGNLIPLHQCIFSDQLTPVLAYRCLVNENDHQSPSFLFESVDHGLHTSSVGRYSIIGTNPAMEIVAKEKMVTVIDHRQGWKTEEFVEDPMVIPRRITEKWVPRGLDDLPQVFCGGWVGYFSYDTMRYAETRLTLPSAPVDDRNLPDLHLGLYDNVLVFDHVEKKVYVIHWVQLDRFSSTEEAFHKGMDCLESLLSKVHNIVNPRLSSGSIELDTRTRCRKFEVSSLASEAYKAAILKAKEHILAGDVIQVVLSRRFERRTFSDPFEVYRALRIVNPSPFMAYIQVNGCVLIASSPKIISFIEIKRKINDRPVNGTSKRGKTVNEDVMLEKKHVNGERHYKEHLILADSTKENVGKVKAVCLTCWDALRDALPLGAVIGEPKIKAMELIDKLEVNRRGPYGGGFSFISFSGDMKIALDSTTIVFPTTTITKDCDKLCSHKNRRQWVAHLQAGTTITTDSDPGDSERECESQAVVLARAIDLAESSLST